MPRRARIIVPNVATHVIQRGNNRQVCFFQRSDYQRFLTWLQEYALECECHVHAYVLMTNHVHLLATPMHADSMGAMMKRLGQRYTQYINRTYERSGTLWEERYRSCLASDDTYVLGCYRYIEMNPIRAAMVRHACDYQWSSYRANAHGACDPTLTPHPIYLALHHDTDQRRCAYRELFGAPVDVHLNTNIRRATIGNTVVGGPSFENQIAVALGRRVTRGRPGRRASSR